MSRVTLSRYLIEQTRSHNTPADLRFLIEVVARACKEISHAVSKGALGGVLGSALGLVELAFVLELLIARELAEALLGLAANVGCRCVNSIVGTHGVLLW